MPIAMLQDLHFVGLGPLRHASTVVDPINRASSGFNAVALIRHGNILPADRVSNIRLSSFREDGLRVTNSPIPTQLDLTRGERRDRSVSQAECVSYEPYFLWIVAEQVRTHMINRSRIISNHHHTQGKGSRCEWAITLTSDYRIDHMHNLALNRFA